MITSEMDDSSKQQRAVTKRRIPSEIRQQALYELLEEERRYTGCGLALAFSYEFKAGCLCVTYFESSCGLIGGATRRRLCRLRYVEGDSWSLEMPKYSSGVDGYGPYYRDHPVYLTARECFAIAADTNLLEARGQAGWSADRQDDLIWRHGPFEGPAMVLSTLANQPCSSVPRLDPPTPTTGRRLLEDFETFLDFIDGRILALSKRSVSLSQDDLLALNGRMLHREQVGKRPIQANMPRIQVCFMVAESLGLLKVQRWMPLAMGTASIKEFRQMDPFTRLWLILEALWNRVRWSLLYFNACGETDRYQRSRHWLATALSTREHPLIANNGFTATAEIFERFLAPCWKDAGLVKLEFKAERKTWASYHTRSTGLSHVRVRPFGRKVFALLAGISPRKFIGRHPGVRSQLNAGKLDSLDGIRLFQHLAICAPKF